MTDGGDALKLFHVIRCQDDIIGYTAHCKIPQLCNGSLLLCGFHETSAIYFTPKKQVIIDALHCKIETLLCVFPCKCNFKHIVQ